jgi:hypothetical protein
MTRWLAHAPAGAILMCHPARAVEPGDEIGAARAQEFSYLSGADFLATLALARVKIARGCEVL